MFVSSFLRLFAARPRADQRDQTVQSPISRQAGPVGQSGQASGGETLPSRAMPPRRDASMEATGTQSTAGNSRPPHRDAGSASGFWIAGPAESRVRRPVTPRGSHEARRHGRAAIAQARFTRVRTDSDDQIVQLVTDLRFPNQLNATQESGELLPAVRTAKDRPPGFRSYLHYNG